MGDNRIAICLSLMRRLPPNKVEQNLSGLLNLLPELTDELLQRVDQPLKESNDVETGRKYLQCDYNRDGDSYRSPWSNKYDPPLDDGFLPAEKLRSMEIEMNELFDAYRELYYEGGTSSVYLWELAGGFAGCFLIKKNVENNEFVKTGTWDSIHVVECKEDSTGKNATYKLTTTVMLNMNVDKSEIGNSNMSGSLTRQAEITSPINEIKTHFSNICKMIEDMEIDIRSNIHELYILKTREIVNSIRTVKDGPSQTANHVMNLNNAVMNHGKNRKFDSETAEV
jgi:capping protein beta